ncbi:hypothetical protein [Amycolatopsis sp. lyj-23]|uniref:hypothetical protein n=1 Tax=Amycolatopsis sp. lyj-23 TaxID=2789283 RepID=UPI00397E8A4E
MNAQHPLLGALTYRTRHAGGQSRWWLLPALLIAAAVIAIADSPGVFVVVSVAAAATGVFGELWRRCSRAAAQIEEILSTELAAGEEPPGESRGPVQDATTRDHPGEPTWCCPACGQSARPPSRCHRGW